MFSRITNNIIAMLGLIICISLLFAASVVLVATEKVFAQASLRLNLKQIHKILMVRSNLN